MIITAPNSPPSIPRPRAPDEESHPTLDDDILNEDVADQATERSAAEFRKDEARDEPVPPPDKARG
jgi:hypothetical protein